MKTTTRKGALRRRNREDGTIDISVAVKPLLEGLLNTAMDKQALKFRGCAACSAGRTGNKGYSEGFFDRSNKNSSTKKPGSARVSPSSCPSLISEYRGSVRVALRKLSAGSSATIHESRWQCDVDIKMSTTLPALTAPCRTRYLSYKVFSAPLILNRILTVYKWGGYFLNLK